MLQQVFRTVSNLIWNSLLIFQRGVLVSCSLFVITLMTLVVILRYIFKTDLYGIEELVVIAAFWLYFIGASYGSYEKTHITADILTIYLKKDRVKALINIIALVISAGVALVFAYWAFGLLIWGLVMKGKSPAWGIPMYIPQSSILVGFALMSFYFLAHLMGDLKKFFSKK